MKLRTYLIWTGLLGGFAVGACDLPTKDIGNESDSMGSGGADDGGQCNPGDTMDHPDGCNTCECGPDGTWGCTLLGCEPTGGGGGGQCEPGDTMDHPDGCNTCQCDVDGQWACTAIGCDPTTGGGDDGGPPGSGDPFDGNEIEICGPSVPFDGLNVTAASISGDTLTVGVSSGGGCNEHLYGGCWDGSFLESFPVQAGITIAHDAMDDPCDAIVTADVAIDLTPMKEAYQQGYQTMTGEIEINLPDGFGVSYVF